MKFKLIPLTDDEQFIHDNALAEKMQIQESAARSVKWIEKVDRLKIYEKFGETSTFNYCFAVLEYTRAESNALKSVAKKSREIPALHEALESGHSLWTVAKLVPHLTKDNAEKWMHKLATLPKAKIEEEISRVSKRKKRDHVDKGETHARLSGDLDNEVFELWKRAQDLQSQKMRKNASFNETMKAMLEIYLDKVDPVRKADRTAAKKAVPEKVQTEKTEMPAKPIYSREYFQRKPLTAAQEDAVNKRDRGECQAEHPNGAICLSTKFVEIHHKIAVELGGSNEPENLITLCCAHHRMLHRHEERADRNHIH